jgi:hypothetical protein
MDGIALHVHMHVSGRSMIFVDGRFIIGTAAWMESMMAVCWEL